MGVAAGYEWHHAAVDYTQPRHTQHLAPVNGIRVRKKQGDAFRIDVHESASGSLITLQLPIQENEHSSTVRLREEKKKKIDLFSGKPDLQLHSTRPKTGDIGTSLTVFAGNNQRNVRIVRLR